MNSDKKTKRIVFLALCLSLALVFAYVETLIPINIGIPGAKLGLPNLMTIMLLYTLGPAEAFGVALFRIVMSGFMFGNMFAILYSAAGFLFSFTAMLILKKSGLFGMTGVSVVGGIMHNVGQLCVAMFLTNAYVFSYLPVLAAAGLVAGILIGILGGIMVNRLASVLKRYL